MLLYMSCRLCGTNRTKIQWAIGHIILITKANNLANPHPLNQISLLVQRLRQELHQRLDLGGVALIRMGEHPKVGDGGWFSIWHSH